MATEPTITCTRCGSIVPWGPYCPQCSAYLEFTGDPPWSPNPPEVIDTVSTVTEEEVIIDESEVLTPAPIPAEYETFLRAEETEETQETHTPPAKNFAEVAGIVLVGAGIATAVGFLTNWWVAGGFAALIASWVAFLVAPWFRRTPVPEVTAVLVEPEVIAETEVIEQVRVEAPAVLEARAPQVLPSQVVERTVAVATRTVQGDTPCIACGQLNEAQRHFCDWCGAAMEDAVLQPAIIPIQPEEEAEQAEIAKHRQRGLSRSWRVPILILTLAGVFISAIIFAVFGPNAVRVQFGLTQVYQSINQFINPRAGNIVTPTRVLASSTLPGTQPEGAAGGDIRTFWASDSSFGLGVGTVLTFILPDEAIIDRMVILPGVQGSGWSPRVLATPKDITLTFDDGSTFETTLLKVNADRDFRQLVEFPRTQTKSVVMQINSVYPATGEREDYYGEVALSGVEFISPPNPPQFLRLPTAIPEQPNLPGTVN
jgi:RNA polymerase subunit RPABC4/transcription elongation factor Spt4